MTFWKNVAITVVVITFLVKVAVGITKKIVTNTTLQPASV